MKRAALLLLVLGAVPAVVQAQVCRGQAPWSSGSIKAGGYVEFGEGYTDFAGSLGFGKDRGLFFGAGAGVTSYSGPGGSQVFVEGHIAKEMSEPITDKLELCPIASVAILLPKDEVSGQSALAGVSLGYPLNVSAENLRIVLTGGGQLGFSRVSVAGFSETDFVGVFDFGAGFIFNNRISLVPTLRIPTEGDLAFRIAANVALGR